MRYIVQQFLSRVKNPKKEVRGLMALLVRECGWLAACASSICAGVVPRIVVSSPLIFSTFNALRRANYTRADLLEGDLRNRHRKHQNSV